MRPVLGLAMSRLWLWHIGFDFFLSCDGWGSRTKSPRTKPPGQNPPGQNPPRTKSPGQNPPGQNPPHYIPPNCFIAQYFLLYINVIFERQFFKPLLDVIYSMVMKWRRVAERFIKV